MLGLLELLSPVGRFQFKCGAQSRSCEMVFIVQAKPWKPEGIEKIIAATRKEALQAATEFLRRKFPVVTVVADGRVYTVEEFAKTMVDVEAA